MRKAYDSYGHWSLQAMSGGALLLVWSEDVEQKEANYLRSMFKAIHQEERRAAQ
jgi:hypothetical protein